MRVLLVEDDPGVTRSLSPHLRQAGMTHDIATCGEDALHFARLNTYDAIVLDYLLPDTDGLKLLQAMRRSVAKTTPIIAISGLSDAETRIKTLHAGADDFVVKPFNIAELIARIGAVVRRACGHSDSILRAGAITYDLATSIAYVGNEPVRLTRKESDVLRVLMLRKGKVVSKEMMIEQIYGDDDLPQEKIVDVFICKIRRKFAEVGAPNAIETVWGRGYVLHENPEDQMAPRSFAKRSDSEAETGSRVAA